MNRLLIRMGRPKELYLIFWQLLSTALTFMALIYYDFSWKWWLVGIAGYICVFGLGITVTFHRLLAHKSYHLWKPLEYLFALFANLGCTGSSVGWVFVHRTHHKFSDKPGDPHSPHVLGRVGAMVGQYGEGFNKWMVKDIIHDPVHRFYHDYYNILITLYPLTLFFFFGFEYQVFLSAFPVFLNTVVSRLSNWIDHEPAFGQRPYESQDNSHNVWWWSLVTFGEGWHNNHHGHPGNFKFGLKWYQFDPGRYLIEFLHLVGLVKFKKTR